MKHHLNHCLLAAALVSGANSTCTAAAEDNPLRIHRAVEVEIETEHGRSYRLQRSTNMVHWEDVEDSVYGHGGREDRLFSTRREDRPVNEYFRVVVTEAPTNGLAPWSFAGATLHLDDSPGGDSLNFLSETNGIETGSSTNAFVYSFTRTGTNEVRVETHPPTYYFDRRNVYLFTFTGQGMGTWVRDEYRKGKLKDRDTGVFNMGGTNSPSGSTNPPPAVPTEVPSALAGLSYTFQSGETPERLEFRTATSGIEFGDDAGDDELNTFSYTHTLSASNTASIVVTFKPGRWDEYSLIYNSAARGTFIRREFKDNLLVDTDTGAFSAIVLPNSGGNNPPGGDLGTMHTGNSLAGFTYAMNDGSPTIIRLVVASATAGTQLDDSAPTQFTYTFSSTGANTASLVVQFKADKWDEYDLTFADGTNTGTFVRREFDKNALKDTDTGNFAGSPTAP